MASNLDTISKAVQGGDDKQTVKLVKEALDAGTTRHRYSGEGSGARRTGARRAI